MIFVSFGLPSLIFIFVICGAVTATFPWKCKGCSALHCKPSGLCSASDGETQPQAAPWFFYSDMIIQEAWASCASSCPLIELPCGHLHYSGTYAPSKYDIAISCESNGMQCAVAIPLAFPSSSSLSRILQLSLTPHNPWIQVAGNSSCGDVHTQLKCNGNARLWIRGGMYTGQEQAWVGVAALRCTSCDSSVAAWTPTNDASSHRNEPAISSQQPDSLSSRPLPQAHHGSSRLSALTDSIDNIGEVSGPCFPLSACLTVGQTASGVLIAIATACIDEDCHRHMLISARGANSPASSHIFSFASIERAVVSRHDAALQFSMRSGPAFTLYLPLSPCTFSHHILLELRQHFVLLDDVATATLNNSCAARALPVLQGDSVCVREADAAAAHQMATAWHDHLLHLQIVSGSHISQEEAEAAQLKLQTQARTSLCAGQISCEITCLSCDGAFIASSSSRIVVAQLPLDKPVHAHLLSQISSVDTMSDGAIRLFLVHDEFSEAGESHVRQFIILFCFVMPLSPMLHAAILAMLSHLYFLGRLTFATLRTR
jgi:hypothetical protein